MHKKTKRQRRARRTRARIALQGVHRLCVHRTPRHIYAQIIDPGGARTVVSASTIAKELRETLKATGNREAAAAVGKLIAERAKEQGIERGRIRPLGVQVSRPGQGACRCGA